MCECVALTKLGPFLAGMWWLPCLRRFLKRHFAFDSRDRQGLWSAGEHCEAVCSCPYHLRGCAQQLLVHLQVSHACMHARTRICGCECVCGCLYLCVCVCVFVCVKMIKNYAHATLYLSAFVRVSVCVMMMWMYTHEMSCGGALCICGWSVLASVFVQCWRVCVHEPVFVCVDLVSSCPCHSPLCQ